MFSHLTPPVKAHPEVGSYLNWILIGAVLAPGKPLMKERAKDFPDWSLDRLPHRMEKFGEMVHTPKGNVSQVSA